MSGDRDLDLAYTSLRGRRCKAPNREIETSGSGGHDLRLRASAFVPRTPSEQGPDRIACNVWLGGDRGALSRHEVAGRSSPRPTRMASNVGGGASDLGLHGLGTGDRAVVGGSGRGRG